MNKIKCDKIILALFILMELLLYITFLYQDIFKKGSLLVSTNLKFSSIILCFVAVFWFYARESMTLDIVLLRCAFLFTLISDLCILMLDFYYLGLITFCIVQLLYLIRLNCWRKKQGIHSALWILILRNVLFAMAITGILITLKISLGGLVLISIFYFVSIFFNTVDAIRIHSSVPKIQYKLYAIGMVLFFLCDLNVGLFNLSDYIQIEESWFHKVYEFATIAMWMFYLPSQVLISLSGFNRDSFSEIH